MTNTLQYKVCARCGQAKLLSDFRKGRVCKACVAEYMRKYATENKARLTAYKADWAARNPESNKRATEAYRERNREREALRARLVRINRPDAVWACVKSWRQRNLEATTEFSTRRRSRILQASSIASDMDIAAMLDCNRLAATYRSLFGLDVHVDHIVPIAAPDVCGLHVPWNLRIVAATTNLKKHTKWRHEDALSQTGCFEDWALNERV